MSDQSNVTAYPKRPYRVTPEMIVRFLMGNMDKLDEIVVACTFKENQSHPLLTYSDITPQFAAYVASRLLSDPLRAKKGPHEGGPSGEPKNRA